MPYHHKFPPETKPPARRNRARRRKISNGQRAEFRVKQAWRKTPWPSGRWSARRDDSTWKRGGVSA